MNTTPKPKVIFSSRALGGLGAHLPPEPNGAEAQGYTGQEPEVTRPEGHREKAIAYAIRALKSSKVRFALVLLDDDEFALCNFARFRHNPARIDAWAKSALHAYARETIKKHLAAGHKISPDVAELVDKFRDR